MSELDIPRSPLSTASSGASDAAISDLAQLSDVDDSDFELIQSEGDDSSSHVAELSDSESEDLNMSKASFIAERKTVPNLDLSYPDPEQEEQEHRAEEAARVSVPSTLSLSSQSTLSDSGTIRFSGHLSGSTCDTPTAHSPLATSLLTETVDPALFAQSKPDAVTATEVLSDSGIKVRLEASGNLEQGENAAPRGTTYRQRASSIATVGLVFALVVGASYGVDAFTACIGKHLSPATTKVIHQLSRSLNGTAQFLPSLVSVSILGLKPKSSTGKSGLLVKTPFLPSEAVTEPVKSAGKSLMALRELYRPSHVATSLSTVQAEAVTVHGFEKPKRVPDRPRKKQGGHHPPCFQRRQRFQGDEGKAVPLRRGRACQRKEVDGPLFHFSGDEASARPKRPLMFNTTTHASISHAWVAFMTDMGDAISSIEEAVSHSVNWTDRYTARLLKKDVKVLRSLNRALTSNFERVGSRTKRSFKTQSRLVAGLHANMQASTRLLDAYASRTKAWLTNQSPEAKSFMLRSFGRSRRGYKRLRRKLSQIPLGKHYMQLHRSCHSRYLKWAKAHNAPIARYLHLLDYRVKGTGISKVMVTFKRRLSSTQSCWSKRWAAAQLPLTGYRWSKRAPVQQPPKEEPFSIVGTCLKRFKQPAVKGRK